MLGFYVLLSLQPSKWDGDGIIGPIFLDSNVNAEVYLNDILSKFIEHVATHNLIDGY